MDVTPPDKLPRLSSALAFSAPLLESSLPGDLRVGPESCFCLTRRRSSVPIVTIVSQLLPKANGAVGLEPEKKDEIMKDQPGITKEKSSFTNLSRASYQKNWGQGLFRPPTLGGKIFWLFWLKFCRSLDL